MDYFTPDEQTQLGSDQARTKRVLRASGLTGSTLRNANLRHCACAPVLAHQGVQRGAPSAALTLKRSLFDFTALRKVRVLPDRNAHLHTF